jgi:hypothetical protein
MNIIKELHEFKSDKDCLDKLIDDIAIQQNELAKKSHLLKAIGISSLIEDAVLEDFFKNAEIKKIQICLGHQYDDSTGDYEYRLTFTLVDSNNTVIPRGKIPINSEQLQKFFHTVFYAMKDLSIDSYCEKLRDNSKYYLELKPGVGEKILDLFLCDELKKVYEYSNMQIGLHESESHNKRFKV